MIDSYVDSLPLTKQLEIEERTLNNTDSTIKREVPRENGTRTNEACTMRGGLDSGNVWALVDHRISMRGAEDV